MSADGRRLVVDGPGPQGNSNIWAFETDRGARSLLTLHSRPVNDISPVWSPDGNAIAYSSNMAGNYDVYRKSLRGQGTEEVLVATPQLDVPSDWSGDGQVLLFVTLDQKTGTVDIMGLRLNGGPHFEVVRTSANESSAQFSPDGRWIAYRSDKSGRFEIYVQPFPLGQGSERVISTSGGAQPRWSPDGKELFYVAFDEQLMTASITPAPDGRSVTPGAPAPLFRTNVGGAVQSAADQQYVVSRDGRRFLMATIPREPDTPPISVILNWKKK
jgi:Tol biopolymer transport system component